MAAPQPKTQAQRLIERMDALSDRHEVTEFEERSIRKEIELIGRTDRLSADMITCDLESFLGNRDAVAKAIKSMKANGFEREAEYGQFFFSAGVLQASKAHELLGFVFPHPTRPLHDAIDPLFMIGAFRGFIGFVNQAIKEKRTIKGAAMIPAGKEIVSILDRLNISDQQISSIIDEAGIVMEAHGHHRVRGMMHFIIPPEVDEDTPSGALRIEYRLATTPEDAADMNWELLDRIVDRDLDVAGLTVGFAGIK